MTYEIALQRLTALCASAEHCETESEVAVIAPFAQHIGDGCTGKHTYHVHDAISRSTLAGSNKLAEDWHIVGIEHTEADTEQQTCTDDTYYIMTEAQKQERRNGQSQTDST